MGSEASQSKLVSNPFLQKLSNRVIIQKSGSSFPACGLYILNPDIIQAAQGFELSLPLLNIDYNIQIINHLAKISLTQTYENDTEAFLETSYSFPVDPKIVVHQFRAKFQNVIISGEVKEKEQAKEQFKQALSEGRQAAYAQIDEDSYDIMNLKVGNIPPKTKVTIEIEFIQQLEVEMNTLYKLRIPSVITPRYLNLTKQSEKPENNWVDSVKKFLYPNQHNAKYTWSFNLKLLSQTPLTFNNSTTHDLLQTSINQTKTQADFILSETQKPNKDFVFVYKNQEVANCTIGKNDLTTSAAISFIPKYAEIKADDAFKMMLKDQKYETDIETASGQYIFVLDRSGSMSGGRITKAIEALKLFLKSLPSKTIFNIISFGDNYQSMFPESVQYTDNNIKHAVNQLSYFSADLGGTQILPALKHIFNKKYVKDYPRQIFLLTDGGVSNTNSVIKLVKDNVKHSRVHTIGVGNGCSIALIKGCAEKGKGKAVFITDQGQIASPIIELLSSSLSPVITSFKLEYDPAIVESIVPNPNSMPCILKDQPVNFYIMFKEGFKGKTIINLKYTESVHNIPYENQVIVDTQKDTLNFPFVDKIAQHKTISVMVDKLKDKNLIDQDLLIAKIGDLQKEIVRRSVKSQVLCPLTAFICVGKKLEDGKYLEFLSKGQQAIVVSQHQSVDYQDSPRQYLAASSSYGGASYAPKGLFGIQPQSSPMRFCALPSPPSASFSIPPPPSPPKKSYQPEQNYMRGASSFNQPVPTMLSASKSSFSGSFDMFGPPPQIGQGLFSGPSSYPSNTSESKNETLIEFVVSNQKIDGSWEASSNLVSRLFQTSSQTQILQKLCQQTKLDKNSIVTIIIVAWLLSKHNTPAYSLIIKKGKSWITKNKIDQQIQTHIVSKLTIG